MQLGVALFIHANIQPYVAYAFFAPSGDTEQAASGIDQIYQTGLTNFFKTYLVYVFCMLGMIIGLTLGKRFLSPSANYQPRIIYFCASMLSTGCILGASFLPTASF